MGAKKVKIKKIFTEHEIKQNKMKLIAVQDQQGEWKYQEMVREEA